MLLPHAIEHPTILSTARGGVGWGVVWCGVVWCGISVSKPSETLVFHLAIYIPFFS